MSAAAVTATVPGAVPADVRAAGPQAVDGFRSALSFEKVLLDKLLSAALPEEEGEEGTPKAANLAETLSDAIVSQGGAGIAPSLFGGSALDAGAEEGQR
jgi:hypothetical protein